MANNKDFIVKNGVQVLGRDSLQSTNTTTGALVVNGGVGIGGNLNVGGTITANKLVVEYTTVTTTLVQTDDVIQTSNSTQATSTNTGALVVTGGVGIGRNLYVGGSTLFQGPVTFAGTATYILTTNTVYTDNIIELHTPPGGMDALWTVDDGKDIGFHLHYFKNGTDTNAALLLRHDSKYLEWFQDGTDSTSNGNNFTATTYGTFKTGSIILANTTASVSTATGALVVAGGVGIGGDLNVAGNITANSITVQYTTVTTNLVTTDDIIITTNSTQATNTSSGALQVTGGAGIGGDLYASNLHAVNNFTAASGQIAGAEIVSTATFSTQLGTALETVTYIPYFITMDPTTVPVPTVGTTTTYGTYNFGSLSDIQTFGDYNTATNTGFYSVNDATGTPAHVEYIGWTGITKFNRVVLNINYTQSSGHTIDMDLYNFEHDSWDTLAIYSGSPGWQQFALGVIDDVPYISNSGTSVLRIYHVSPGNTAHRTWIDYVALEQSTTGGQGPRGATGATGATGAQGVNTGTTTTFVISNYTPATSTTTGALQVYGGVGIRGDVYIGGTLYANSQSVITTATLGSYGVTSITAGTDTAVSSSIGDITIWDTSTLQSVTTRGATTNSQIQFTNTSSSNSTATGAVTVAGGMGIGGNIYVGGSVIQAGASVYDTVGTSVDTNPVVLDGFDIGLYRSARYFVSVSNATTQKYQSTDVLLVQDGTNAYIEATSVFSNGNTIMTFSAAVTGTNVILMGTGASANNVVKIQATYIAI